MSSFALPNPSAFTAEEESLAQDLLASLVLALRHVPGGGKMEEDYWSFIYHSVRGISPSTWSNLPMRDYSHGGVGVEMKLLKRRTPHDDQGHRIMHPAATRTITFDPSDPAEVCKETILRQFGAQIAAFRSRVQSESPTGTVEIRWGILLWKPNLSEFLYFEEEMTEPNPDDFRAEFVSKMSRGKPSRNLHIFEKSTGLKRFSVTMPANGAKVQPYYDVPRVGHGAYAFTVPDDNRKPLWLQEETIEGLREAAAGKDVNDYLRELLGL